jgi:hypothetical protein
MIPPTHVPANLASPAGDARPKLGLMAVVAVLMLGFAASSVPMSGSTGDAAPALLVVRHDVADPRAWRRAFDGALPLRREAGELAAHVATDPRGPGAVTAVFLWRSAAEARAFADSELLADGMRRAGVVGAPRIEVIAGHIDGHPFPEPASALVAAAD